MTLNVNAYRVDEHGRSIDPPLASDLAGVQSSLHWFYGGDRAVAAGLVLLPMLGKDGGIEVRGAELGVLKRECEIMIALPEDAERESWEFRLGNILEAIALASPYGDAGVVTIG